MYNVEKFIETCIGSILWQTFEDFEVIIVDDCSTDRSAEIVESFDDPRIRLVKNITNLGSGLSHNIGISLSRGKYIYFMDSDDAIMPQTLEIFYQAAEEDQYEVVFMGGYMTSTDFSLEHLKIDGIYVSEDYSRILSENRIERLKQELTNSKLIVMPWSRFYRRDFMLKYKIRFMNSNGLEDLAFHFMTLYYLKHAKVIAECCYIWRTNPDGISRTFMRNFERRIVATASLIEFVEKVFSEETDEPISHEDKLMFGRWLIVRYITEEVALPKNIEELDRMILDSLKNVDSHVTQVILHSLLTMIFTNKISLEPK